MKHTTVVNVHISSCFTTKKQKHKNITVLNCAIILSLVLYVFSFFPPFCDFAPSLTPPTMSRAFHSSHGFSH